MSLLPSGLTQVTPRRVAERPEPTG